MGNNMDKRFDFNLLVIFLEVYQLRSITLAADSLGLTQPGVSAALKRLQATLGVELFVREGRGISPTNAAIQLASQVSPAYNTVNSALSNVAGFDKQTPRSFLVYVDEPMMNLLQPLAEQDSDMGNCEIMFQLPPIEEERLLQQLSLQKADLAIDVGQLPSLSYSNQLFYRESVTMICRKGHPRINGKIGKIQFYQEKHITLQIRRATLTALDFFTEEVIGERKVSCECHSLLSMMALVSESDCIAITSRSIADKYADKFGLQSIEPPFNTKPVLHNMMWHKRNEFNPAHTWLREKLNQLVKQWN
ncbi:transcriptional regulator, LysR family [Shewanella pealeana ATCC 700345]|uniref:Transcriptional regulator, LysR family n=2 Tax=Shewanella pealeana TaxID=70864 RepID=A8H3B3_SHEPA|nr:transcriptional regulator, LysR family [Shewanella pealeana ATCC 700345]